MESEIYVELKEKFPSLHKNVLLKYARYLEDKDWRLLVHYSDRDNVLKCEIDDDIESDLIKSYYSQLIKNRGPREVYMSTSELLGKEIKMERCPKCHKTNTIFMVVQLRCVDEPSNLVYNCLESECRYSWKK